MEGDREYSRRELVAERIGEVLDPFMIPLGLGQAVAFLTLNECVDVGPARSALETLFLIVWPVFVLEYLARMVVAPSTAAFLRRNWWEVPILALPFLRVLRVLRVARVARTARTGRALGSVLRTGRRTGRTLVNRLGALAIIHVLVVLAGVNLSCDYGGYGSFTRAFRDVWVLATAGQPMGTDGGVQQLLDVFLTTWAVVVFAALAGSIGAFFLERDERVKRETEPADGPLF
ncbi:MAG TPA: hypothetical protein VM840_12840 [Actinomycetota bacterium]|nr:hypothetical protein [Actinomycetota bacterium]